MPRPTRARTAHHEASHAVAHHFLPLAGRTVDVTIAREKLAAHNASRRPVNHAWGYHAQGATLPAIRGCSVDREQLHHELMALLAGPAADWLYCGAGPTPSSRRARAFARRHAAEAAGNDDCSRALKLLEAADPFDTRAAVASISEGERRSASAEELVARYGRPAVRAHQVRRDARFEALLREAVQLVASKWPHVTAIAAAVLRRGTLSGDEVTQIIEAVEARLAKGPPIDWLDRERGSPR